MDDDERALGGYSPDAGRNAHQADAPTLIPVPSLLRSLLSDHLDPGYAAAALAAAKARPAEGPPEWAWRLLAGVAVAAVFACAAAQARSVAPATRETQHVLVDSVRSAETGADDVTLRRDALVAAVEAERRSRLEGDQLGRDLLANLDAAESVASATLVHGPGLTITITEPKSLPDLSDVSKQRLEGRRQVILDRDLQLVVNSLWASGAEAMSVGGVRIGPNMTIRQAGGGILVDNRPITNPSGAYVILAVGPQHGMREQFDASPGLQRIRLLEASYGVGVTVTENADLEVPGGSARELNFAKQIGPPMIEPAVIGTEVMGSCVIGIVALVVGIVLGLVFHPSVPEVIQPYLPIAVVAALDAVFGGLRAYLERIFDAKVFVISFVFNVLVAAVIVYVGDQLGVGTQLSTAIIVVLGIRIFGNAAALRRRLFGA